MNIIFNEKRVAEDIINNNRYSVDDYSAITILAKYYYLQGYENKDNSVSELIMSTLKKCNPKFKRTGWKTSTRKAVNGVYKDGAIGKFNVVLTNIEYVDIYEEELEFIKNSNTSKVEKKLMFVLLVYCKAYNIYNSNNANMESEELISIFRKAKCMQGNYDFRILALAKLQKKGYLNMKVWDKGVSVKVNYLKEDGEVVLRITDFDRCIYPYLVMQGEKWKMCECGEWFKPKANNQIYCNKCAKEKQKEWQRKSMKKARQN